LGIGAFPLYQILLNSLPTDPPLPTYLGGANHPGAQKPKRNGALVQPEEISQFLHRKYLWQWFCRWHNNTSFSSLAGTEQPTKQFPSHVMTSLPSMPFFPDPGHTLIVKPKS